METINKRLASDCFYCQELKKLVSLRRIRTRLLTGGSLCNFCGVYNDPLWMTKYKKQEQSLGGFIKPRQKFFCCGCAWWQLPHDESEKATEEEWFQRWKFRSAISKKKRSEL